MERRVALQQVPKDEDVETWIYQWIDLVTEGVNDGWPWMQFLVLFIRVVDELDPDFRAELSLSGHEFFESAALHYLRYWHTKRAYGSEPPQLQIEDAPDKTQRPNRRCVCGPRHEFKDCYYLIPSIRPRGWKGHRKNYQRIDALLAKNRKLKATITSIQRQAKREEDGFSHPEPSDSSSDGFEVPLHDESLFGRVSFAA